MKKILSLFVAGFLFPVLVFAQVYTYSKVPGESVTFAWDNSPIQISCGTQTITLTNGQASYTCEGKTYPLVWTGEDVKIVGGKTGGGDLLISQRYGFQAVNSASTGAIVPATGPGNYTFTVPAAGRYVVWGYVKQDDTGSMDSFFTSMDGSAQNIWTTPRGGTGWVWDRVLSTPTVMGERGSLLVFILSAGTHIFTLSERETGTQINGLAIGTENSSAPVTEAILSQGETKSNQVVMPLSFGEGLFRLKVREVRTWDGSDSISEFASSDGPNAVVNGVAKPWLIEVKTDVVTCTSFTYSEWSPTVCPNNGVQTRTVLTSTPAGCTGGSPVLSRTCIYIPPVVNCTSYTYSVWSPALCPIEGVQTRIVLSSLPAGCVGGTAPVLSQTCSYIPPSVGWPGGIRILNP